MIMRINLKKKSCIAHELKTASKIGAPNLVRWAIPPPTVIEPKTFSPNEKQGEKDCYFCCYTMT